MTFAIAYELEASHYIQPTLKDMGLHKDTGRGSLEPL